MPDFVLNAIPNWLAGKVRGILSWLVTVLTARIFTTPDVTLFPQVRFLAQRSSWVVDAGFALVVIGAGLIAMTHSSVQVQYAAKDLIPRVAFGFVASNFGVQVCSRLIGVANALTLALVGPAASGPKVIKYVRHEMGAAIKKPGVLLLAVIIAVMIVILFLHLLAGWCFRVATLLVLAGVAPIALACYALPQTQPAAQLWWRSLLGCLAVPVLQAVVFTTGVDLILSPDHVLSDQLAIAGRDLDVFNLFTVMCLLIVTTRIPRMVARYATQGGSTSTAGLVLRAVLVQSLGRRVPGARRLMR